MNTIRSAELGERPMTLGEEAGQLEIYGGLTTPFSDDVILLSPNHTQQIETFVTNAAAAFGPEIGPKEPTYAQTELGVPSLVVRTDCTIIDGEIVAYEMEDSPSGQGITDLIQRKVGGKGIAGLIKNHYIAQTGELPFVIVSGARNHGTDDNVVFGDENYAFDTEGRLTTPSDRLVIVKAIPGNQESRAPYLALQSQALMPLETEGDKTYLKRMGLLQPVGSADDLLLDPQGELASQVVKAQVGSMALGISLFLTSADRQRFTRAGTVTASKLKRDTENYILQKGGALVQPFVPPIQIENNQSRGNAIMRIFALLSSENGQVSAEVIGGCYVARPELIVHGARNAISGAVILEEGEK